MCFLLVPISVLFLRQQTYGRSFDSDNTIANVLAFITHSGIVSVSVTSIVISVSRTQFHAYVNSKLASDPLSQSADSIFHFTLALRLLEIIGSISSGIISDRGYASIALTSGCVISIFGFVAMSIPVQIIHMDTALFIEILASIVTFGISVAYTPIFLIFYQVSLKQGLGDFQISKDYSSICILFTTNCGALVGKYVLADFILPMIKPRGVCLFLGCLLSVATYLSSQYLSKIGLMRNVNKYEEGLTIAIKGIEIGKNVALMNHALSQTSGYESIDI